MPGNTFKNPNMHPKLKKRDCLLYQPKTCNISTELVLPPDLRGQLSQRGKLDSSSSTKIQKSTESTKSTEIQTSGNV